MSDFGFEFIKIQTCEPIALGYQDVFKITVSSIVHGGNISRFPETIDGKKHKSTTFFLLYALKFCHRYQR